MWPAAFNAAAEPRQSHSEKPPEAVMREAELGICAAVWRAHAPAAGWASLAFPPLLSLLPLVPFDLNQNEL